MRRFIIDRLLQLIFLWFRGVGPCLNQVRRIKFSFGCASSRFSIQIDSLDRTNYRSLSVSRRFVVVDFFLFLAIFVDRPLSPVISLISRGTDSNALCNSRTISCICYPLILVRCKFDLHFLISDIIVTVIYFYDPV